LSDAGFFIFNRDSKFRLQIFGLADGIYNKSEVSAIFDEGTPSPIVASSKFVILMETTYSPVKRQMDTI